MKDGTPVFPNFASYANAEEEAPEEYKSVPVLAIKTRESATAFNESTAELVKETISRGLAVLAFMHIPDKEDINAY